MVSLCAIAEIYEDRLDDLDQAAAQYESALNQDPTNVAALKELFSPRLDDVDLELLKDVHMANQLSDDALDLLTDLPRLAGSNAWAVSPSRSASGDALLASDPHLEVNRLPADLPNL